MPLPVSPILLTEYDTDGVDPSVYLIVILVHKNCPADTLGIDVLHVLVGGVVPLVDAWYSVVVDAIPFPAFPCSPIFPTEYEVEVLLSVYVIKVLVHKY